MRPPHLFALHSVLHLRLALILGVCRTRRVTGARTRVGSCVVLHGASACARTRAGALTAHACTCSRTRAHSTHVHVHAHARVVEAGGGGERRTGTSEHHVAHGPASSTPRLHGLRAGRVMPSGVDPCRRDGAQIRSLGRTTGGLAGGFEAAGATAQEEGKRPGPWLWQGWPRGAAAGEGGRRVNRLEGTGRARCARRRRRRPSSRRRRSRSW